MIDHLHRDSSLLGFLEGAGGVAVQGGPGIGVDLGLKGGFQGLVGIVGTQEVRRGGRRSSPGCSRCR